MPEHGPSAIGLARIFVACPWSLVALRRGVLMPSKATAVEDDMERLRHVQRELERLREVGAGLANGDEQGEL